MTEASSSDQIFLSPSSSAFLSALLCKIANEILQAQKSTYDETLSDKENLKLMGVALQNFSQLPAEVARIAQLFNVTLRLHDEIDETVLTVKNLNQFIVEVLEKMMRWNQDVTYEVRRVKELYEFVKRPVEPISLGDSIMTHVAFTSALSKNETGTELENKVPSEVAEDQDLPPDEEDIDKYISIFSGEEYDNGRENNPKGDIE